MKKCSIKNHINCKILRPKALHIIDNIEHYFGKGVIPTYQPDANCEYRRMLSRETHGGC